MKRIFLIFCIFLSILQTNAQQIAFSDSAVVSLITCSPGEEVYSKFGHTALRINDKKNNIDIVFNYGIFSFETENFYFKFIKAKLIISWEYMKQLISFLSINNEIQWYGNRH